MDEPDGTSIEALEREFQETLKEISVRNPQVVEPFKVEYEKLHKALLKSHEQEKRLVKKCRDLNSEITLNAAKYQAAQKLSQDHQQDIANFRRQMEQEERQVESSRGKERVAKEQIARFKAEIDELNLQIEQGAGMTSAQEGQVTQLAAQKEQLEKERDMLQQNFDMLKSISSKESERVQKAEATRTKSEEDIAKVRQKLADKKSDIEKEKRRKEQLEQEMKSLREVNDEKQAELESSQKRLKREDEELKRIDHEVREIEKEEARLELRVRQKCDEKRSLEIKLDQEQTKNSKSVQENLQKELSVRSKQEDIKQHSSEVTKTLKFHEALKKKDKLLDEEKRDKESVRNQTKDEIKESQSRLDSLKRDSDSDRKKIEDLLRERDILNKNVIKADDRTKKQFDLVKRQETQALNLQKDIARWKQDAQDFKKRIWDLEREREKYGIELSQANSRYFNALEELKTRDARLTDFKKKIADVRAKLSQQKNLYDAVCSERNKCGKDLIDKNQKIAEMRRRFKIMFHDTTALKEEIREKDTQLIDSHFRLDKTRIQNEEIRKQRLRAEKRMNNLTNIVETSRTEIKKLESQIQEAEQERQAQQKELDGVIGERDILGQQLIRRNEELALLYEKIKIQQSTLEKGEIQYRERVGEVNRLRGEIRKLKFELATARNNVTNVDTWKREVYHLSKVLLREETKCQALEQELANPMNVHRWRELEGTDPATYEMIQKVKSLQKLLIAKTEEVVEKDMLIQEKEKLYVQLKNILARQPGPEVAEQLAWYSENLKEKTAHMKQMVAELRVYHGQCKDLKDEIDRHTKDLGMIKQAYFQRRRQEMKQQQQQQQMQEGDE